MAVSGPSGKGAVNLDSYQTATPPPPPMTTNAVKVIVPTDKKTGPAKPAFLGGVSTTGAYPDCFWE
jgi:hypothetical protein